MKTKHNKKRNTAFLYEVLVREVATSVVKKDAEKKAAAINLIKEAFSADTALSKELELYRILSKKQYFEPFIAERLIQEAKIEYEKIDKKKLFIEQSKIISKINRNLSKNVFSNFVPNYKNLATISQIFNNDLSVKSRVLLEAELLKIMTEEKKEKQEKIPITNLVYKTFVEKFNDAYSDSLLGEQKKLLQHYVSSFSDNGIQLKLFLNEELARLKSVINSALQKEEVRSDTRMVEKTNKVLNLMESFKVKKLDKDMLAQVMKIQNLVREIQE
tara:strand:- start:3567 stop:4385 length:819 start_codon:yes stop_codon:yes gene_type:complete